jgi:hypothetical protein
MKRLRLGDEEILLSSRKVHNRRTKRIRYPCQPRAPFSSPLRKHVDLPALLSENSQPTIRLSGISPSQHDRMNNPFGHQKGSLRHRDAAWVKLRGTRSFEEAMNRLEAFIP